MEPAGQCSYVGCDNPCKTGQKFHNIPVKNAGLCVKWLINSGREDLLTFESTILESMNLAICGDHFQDQDYDDLGNLKEDTVPLQYWDLGYSRELGEITETDIDRQPQICSDDSNTTDDSEWSENDSEIGTDDEFRTQLGNEIEALLNAIQTSRGQSHNKRKQDFDQTLQSFYKKLNLKGDKNLNKYQDSRSMSNLIEFKNATRDMCRTCAKTNIRLVDITDKTDESDIDIITKLKLLIEIKDHDVLPTKICHDCLKKLDQSYTFFQQIYKADNTLRDILSKYKEPNDKISNRSKYNGHIIETKHKSDGFKTEKFCLEVNDLPFKNNGKSTWMLDGSIDSGKIIDTQNSNGFDRNIHKGNNVEDENMPNSEVYSTKNTENTVSYLLSDFCNNDAELNWLDVVGVMEKSCVESYTRKGIINKEEKLTTGGLRISCRYCDSSFRLRRQLKTHITVDHLQPTNNMCEYCNICCKSKEDLSEHHAKVHYRKKYKCNDCGETFNKKLDLKLHIEEIHVTENKNNPIIEEEGSHTRGEKVLITDMTSPVGFSHPDQTFTCNECDKTFSSKKILCNHIHRLHPPFSYTCTICDKVMHSEAETYKHMPMHDRSPLFPCLDCGRMFYSIERLEKHRTTHSQNSSKKRKRVWFHCQLCDASYRIADELIKHIETHSSDDWETYRNGILYCGECNARLIGKKKFRLHKMKYHLAKRGDFICLLCDEVTTNDFQSLKEYEKHINLHCNELKRSAPRRYKCDHCDKAFKSNSHRINHIDSFHSDVMHSCPICNLKVKRKGNLKDHIERVHSIQKEHGSIEIYLGDKRFPCRICGEELLTAKQRLDHENGHEEPLKDLEKMFPWTQRYSCDHCSKKFYYIHKLRHHLLDDHDDKEKAAIIETLEKNRKFKCDECEATFKHKSGLDTHIKGVHSGIEHTCEICGMKCKLASGLKKHLITHDEDRMSYNCQYCDKEFKHDESRKNHELNHHLNNSKRIKRDSASCDGERND